MTNQYEQPSINQQQIQVVSLNTESLDPVDTVLTALQVDGTGIALQFFGGGLEPGNPLVEAYTVRGTAIGVRAGGFVSVPVGSPIVGGGSPGAPAIFVVGLNNGDLVLRITPGIASLYLHRINVRKRMIS